VVWIGFHREGELALPALLDGGYQVVGVVTLAEAARSKRSGAVDFRALVQERGVPVFEVVNINDSAAVELLHSLDPDLVLVIGWGQILSREVLGVARIGTVGAHASLLPRNRGSAPVNWAIIRGEPTTGNSLFWLTEGIDEGDLIDQVEITISSFDTCASVYDRVAVANRDMITRLLPQLARGERPGRPQPASDSPILPRRRPCDGGIAWDSTPQDVYNFVRALTKPYPGAFTSMDDQQWTVWACAQLPGDIQCGARPAPPGEILGPVISPVADACGQLVACTDGAIVLLEVEGPNAEVLSGWELSARQWTGKLLT
jgi:methionyl-tRNA formyltransferase